MAIAAWHLVDGRTGRNGRNDLVGMLRQSVFGRLAGYEANDVSAARAFQGFIREMSVEAVSL